MSQTNEIMHHLKKYRSITSLEALKMYGCMRLASRINDLRNEGINIDTERESRRSKHGKKHYARYFLK